MNTFVFYATLVCLAIAGSANCKSIDYEEVEKHYELGEGDSKIVFYVLKKKPSASNLSLRNRNENGITLEDKCRENGHRPDAFKNTQKGMKDFYSCMNTRNVTEIIRKLNNMDVQDISETDGSFFKSVCKKVPDWKYCGENYTESLRECLNNEENDLLTTIQITTLEIESFLCSNDASSISAFFSRGGVDCVLDKQYAINGCLNILTNSLIRKSGPVSFDSFVYNLKFTKDQCEDFRQFQFCVVNELSLCNDLTTSKLVNSMAQLILNNTPCMKFKSFQKALLE